MADVITDTGPVLHLSEIDHLRALNIFARITMPRLVLQELEKHNVSRGRFENQFFELIIADVPESKWQPLTQLLGQPTIHPIDALFTLSTLHASRAFRAYIEKLLADLE